MGACLYAFALSVSRWILRKHLVPLSGFEVYLNHISVCEVNMGTNYD